MDFRLSSFQSQLQESARRMLSDTLSSEQIREAENSEEGFPRSTWDDGIKLGWPGIELPEEFGGSNCSLLDTCILAEEFGHGGATLPFVVSSGFVSTVLQRSPQGEVRDRLLTNIASGNIICPALIEEQGRNEWGQVRLPLNPAGGDYSLAGRKILVPFAAAADELLVSAVLANSELALVVVDPNHAGLSVTPHQTKTGVPLCSIEFHEVQIPDENIVCRGGDARKALNAGLQAGSLLSIAEAVGLCEALIKMTAAHVTVREAFGQPIGAFQAVAHPCADMRISTETIRLLVYEAAWLIDHGKDASEEVASTKALANELFSRLANDAFRVHGAIAYSNEYDLQLFTRRLQWFCQTLGETEESLQRAAFAHRKHN